MLNFDFSKNPLQLASGKGNQAVFKVLFIEFTE